MGSMLARWPEGDIAGGSAMVITFGTLQHQSHENPHPE